MIIRVMSEADRKKKKKLFWPFRGKRETWTNFDRRQGSARLVKYISGRIKENCYYRIPLPFSSSFSLKNIYFILFSMKTAPLK